jgi:hypothetical protein
MARFSRLAISPTRVAPLTKFATCYAPYWGRRLSRTWPVPGNHEYETPDAAPYFAYFGAVAGHHDEGWCPSVWATGKSAA